MPEDNRKPIRIEEEKDEGVNKRELPPVEDDPVERKHFPGPGRDIPVPPLPAGHTDSPTRP